MIGTVAGFIYMLGNSFTQLSVGDASSMMAALKQMGAGMATALYTTGVGLVCSILLKIQVFNLDQHLNFGWGKAND
jgi:biopolymer transport protein ExbB/TolQ